MKLDEVKHQKTEMQMVSAKIPLSHYKYVREHNVNLTKLVTLAIEDLMNIENGDI